MRSLLGVEEEAKRLLEEPAVEAVTQKLTQLRGTRLGPYEVRATGSARGGWARSTGPATRGSGRDGRRQGPARRRRAEDAERRPPLRAARRAPRRPSTTRTSLTVYDDRRSTMARRFVAFELLEGETLRARLDSRRPAA